MVKEVKVEFGTIEDRGNRAWLERYLAPSQAPLATGPPYNSTHRFQDADSTCSAPYKSLLEIPLYHLASWAVQVDNEGELNSRQTKQAQTSSEKSFLH